LSRQSSRLLFLPKLSNIEPIHEKYGSAPWGNKPIFRATEQSVDCGVRLGLLWGGTPLSFAEVIRRWRRDAEFVDFFRDLLAGYPCRAFRWETPALVDRYLECPFECVVLDAPDLAGRTPDTRAFSRQLACCTESDSVATFPNLGGDAEMVVPAALVDAGAYIDLAGFCRRAPPAQQRRLWAEVGRAMQRRVGETPVWLNTAGGGVAWLHVRLDDRPKYYRHSDYRRSPRA